MFFANSRERFLWINWLDCEQYGMNQKRKRTQSTQFSVCHRSIDNSNDFFYLVVKWLMTTKWKLTSSWITNQNPLSQTLDDAITLSHDYIKRLRWNSGGQADDNINQLHFAIGRRRYFKPQFCAIELKEREVLSFQNLKLG